MNIYMLEYQLHLAVQQLDIQNVLKKIKIFCSIEYPPKCGTSTFV